MKSKAVRYLFFCCFVFIIISTFEAAILIKNTLKDIESIKETLKLELVKVWGGDEEEDVRKFFKTINSMAIDSKGMVYICDSYCHCIKVFTKEGEYTRTIGQRGKGPGDLLVPTSITIAPDGDLLVLEAAGFRLQRFGPDGKSKKIIKLEDSLGWIGMSPRDEVIIHTPRKTFLSRKLISILDKRGKTVREIGQFHDKSKSFSGSERILFSIDQSGNIYAANKHAPVIRKYSTDGKLVMVINFEVPFEIPPVQVTFTSNREDVKILNEGEKTKVTRVKGGVVQGVKKKGKQWEIIFNGIGTDYEQRCYIVTPRRLLTEQEQKKFSTRMSGNGYSFKKEGGKDIPETIDLHQLLVFNSLGKVVAQMPLRVFCSDIYIHGDRIFIIDLSKEARILEYKMNFTKSI